MDVKCLLCACDESAEVYEWRQETNLINRGASVEPMDRREEGSGSVDTV